MLNGDDEYGQKLVKISRKRSSEVLTYGLTKGDFHAEKVEITPRGTRFDLVGAKETIPLFSPLIGKVNVYNILAAAGAAYLRNCKPEEIAQGIAALTRVPGRFERVDCQQPFTVVVDYAHTDDALRNLTALAREFVQQAGQKGKVITVFGCGGDRDRAKRPLMGEAAGRGSDFVILTSDNPRSEDPLAIINDAMVGLQRSGTKYKTEPDRKAAIALAVREAHPGDIVLIAGKGHEKVQITRDGRSPFRRCGGRAESAARCRIRLQVVQRRRRKTQMKLPLSRIAEFTSASGEFDHKAIAQAYSIDSRTIQPGELFFAVKGERMDGHDFVQQALEKGAVAAVVRKDELARYAVKTRLLAVADTLVALQTLGAAVRRLWAKPLIGVTGSTGKTTTKEAIAHVLSSRFRVLEVRGQLQQPFRSAPDAAENRA